MTPLLRTLIVYHTFSETCPLGDPSVWYRCDAFAKEIYWRGGQATLLNQRQLSSQFTDGFEFSRFDVVIFFRPQMNLDLANFLYACDTEGKAVAASYDDLTFLTSTWIESSTLKSGQLRRVAAERYRMAANAFDYFDRFVVSSPRLAEHVREAKPDADVVQIENVLPPDYTIYAAAAAETAGQRRHIGYFGGGKSHGPDIEAVMEDCRAVCLARGLRLLCPDYLTSFIPAALHDVIDPFPRLNIVRLVELYARCRITLAPLQLDQNAACKSSLKFVESIGSLAPLVATPLDAFAPYRALGSLIEVPPGATWRPGLEAALARADDAAGVAADRAAAQATAAGINDRGIAALAAWAH